MPTKKTFKAMDNNADRFNALTNSLLVLILSYLPFKEAARTAILSKQWLNLWRETTILEFNEDFFVKRENNEENQNLQRRAFIDFVRQLIINYPQKPIRKFAMAFSKSHEYLHDIKSFVGFAISKDVKEFELDFSDPTWREDGDGDGGLGYNHPTLFDLPVDVYQYVGLLSLKLFACRFDISRVTDFSILKSVSLGWMPISMASINALLVACPLLESLSLKKCRDIDHFELTLPNLSLKKLVLDKCNFVHDLFWIEGPRLEFFKYSGKIGHFHILNQRHLVEVDLDFSLENEFEEVGALLYDFVQEFYAAQVLTVCSVLLQILPLGEEPFRLLASLDVRHLILKTEVHFNEYFGIRFMLRSCPLIQILTIDIRPGKIFPDYEPPYPYNPREFWSKNVRVPRCIGKNLEVVNIKGFRGKLSEVYFLKYLLYFGSRLREVNIYVSKEGVYGEDKEAYMSRIRKFKPIIRSKTLTLSVFF